MASKKRVVFTSPPVTVTVKMSLPAYKKIHQLMVDLDLSISEVLRRAIDRGSEELLDEVLDRLAKAKIVGQQ